MGMRVLVFVALVSCTASIVFLLSCNPRGLESSPASSDLGIVLCSDSLAEGCPCEAGRVAACYPESPLEDPSTGEQYCVQGTQECGPDGRWESCRFPDGAVRFPLIGDPELCGGCDPNCWRVHDCPVEIDLNSGNAFNVRFDLDAQGLVLGGNYINARYAFIANSPESTVSKIDLETGDEVGRYLVGLESNGTNNHPSRTAIDSMGNSYVANRAFDRQGSVTKIAGDESFCVDRNLNGVIETSTGSIVKAWNQDECVLWTTSLGPIDSRPRAVAVDANDKVWVGLHNTRRFDVLNAGDGTIETSVDVSIRPYGAAISADGILWFPDNCCGRATIQYIDTANYTVSGTYRPPSGLCDGSYGIVVDTEGRVILGGARQPCVTRFTPRTNSWEAFRTTDGTRTRGVTIDADGRIWTAHHTRGGDESGPHWLTSWASDGSDRQIYTLENGSQKCGIPIGVGADFDGNMWISCQNTSRLVRVNPNNGDIDFFPTGPNPYTYSDFTGFLRAHVTSPEGSYVRLHDSRLACSDDRTAHWSQLYWEVETPTDTEIVFWGRTAENSEQLGLSPQMELARIPSDVNPIDVEAIMIANGVANTMRYFEIRVQLIASNGDVSPVFKNMDTLFYCQCGCDADIETCSPDCDCDPGCS